MDENFKKIIPYALKFKNHIFWNVFFNIFYALFSTLSFISLFPLMEVLFKMNEKVVKLPKYNGIWEITSYGKEYLQYYITKLTIENGIQYALLLTVALVIFVALFFKENSFFQDVSREDFMGFLDLSYYPALKEYIVKLDEEKFIKEELDRVMKEKKA